MLGCARRLTAGREPRKDVVSMVLERVVMAAAIEEFLARCESLACVVLVSVVQCSVCGLGLVLEVEGRGRNI